MSLPFALDKAKSGDQEELRLLFDWLIPKLADRIRRYTRHQDEVNDIVQESMVSIYRHIDSISDLDENRFLAWCFAVARNVTVSRLRKSNRKIESLEADVADSSEPETRLEELDEMKHLQHQIETALEGLSEIDRTLFSLRYTNSMSYQEIAERMSMTTKSVHMRLYRVINRIRNLVEQNRLD